MPLRKKGKKKVESKINKNRRNTVLRKGEEGAKARNSFKKKKQAKRAARTGWDQKERTGEAGGGHERGSALRD